MSRVGILPAIVPDAIQKGEKTRRLREDGLKQFLQIGPAVFMDDLIAELPDKPDLVDGLDQAAFVGAVEGVEQGAPILQFNLVDAAESLLNNQVAGAGKPPGQGLEGVEFVIAVGVFAADRPADVIGALEPATGLVQVHQGVVQHEDVIALGHGRLISTPSL